MSTTGHLGRNLDAISNRMIEEVDNGTRTTFDLAYNILVACREPVGREHGYGSTYTKVMGRMFRHVDAYVFASKLSPDIGERLEENWPKLVHALCLDLQNEYTEDEDGNEYE